MNKKINLHEFLINNPISLSDNLFKKYVSWLSQKIKIIFLSFKIPNFLQASSLEIFI